MKRVKITVAVLAAGLVVVGQWELIHAAKVAGCVEASMKRLENQYGPAPTGVRDSVLTQLVAMCTEELK